jgi:hypothetical protein
MRALSMPRIQNELFVAEAGSNSVNIYTNMGSRNGGTLAGTITEGISVPFGVWIDRRGTLYVANFGNSTVTEYPRGSGTPSSTISQGVSLPWGVAVDSRGTLYVADWSGSLGGYIDEYPAGSTTPTIQIKGFEQPAQMTFDSSNNLYVADNGGGGFGSVWEVPFGTTKLENLSLEDLEQPIGIALDSNDDLFVSDNSLFTNEVFVFLPGHRFPSCEITQGLGSNSGTDAVMIAIGKRGTLYVAQQNTSRNIFASILTYSASGYALRSTTTVDMNRPIGVAIWERI